MIVHEVKKKKVAVELIAADNAVIETALYSPRINRVEVFRWIKKDSLQNYVSIDSAIVELQKQNKMLQK